MAHNIPDPNVVFPNAYKTSCFLKNVVQAPNVTIGDYTYYADPQDPRALRKTTSCSTTRSLGISSPLANSATWPAAPPSLWGRRTTGCAA